MTTKKKQDILLDDSLNEAEAIGDSQTLSMIRGVLSSILQKYGGDYQKASSSPEWQTAIENGEKARTASVDQTASTDQRVDNIVKPMQVTNVTPKKNLSDLRPSAKNNLAQQQQADKEVQKTRSLSIADKLRQQQQKKQMEGLERINNTIRESVNEVFNKGTL